MKKENIVPSIFDSTIRIYDSCGNTKKEQECDWHFHNEYEFVFIRQGEKYFYTKKQSISVKEGDVIFINRRVPHRTKTPTGYSGILLQFGEGFGADERYYTGVNSAQKEIIVFENKAEENLQIKSLLEKIGDEYRNEEKGREIFIKSYVSLLSAYLYRKGITENTMENNENEIVERMLPVIRYINENYSRQITLEEVSDMLHVDKSHFCRLFKKATNASFVDYLNFVRVSHGEELLRKTTLSVSQIAYQVGIFSSSYFSELFKKINSMPPSQYRKMIRWGC